MDLNLLAVSHIFNFLSHLGVSSFQHLLVFHQILIHKRCGSSEVICVSTFRSLLEIHKYIAYYCVIICFINNSINRTYSSGSIGLCYYFVKAD